MFLWYQNCKVCIVYLEDISAALESLPSPHAVLRTARWFTRGWTLQELIAPWTLYFYNSTWDIIGDKMQLLGEVHDITGSSPDALSHRGQLHTKSVAQKMSWASRQETTRIEDTAYCLMGLFDVNMPLLYGEGEKAFMRLQEEIIKTNYDHSMFGWSHQDLDQNAIAKSLALRQAHGGIGILAPHPSAFSSCASLIPYTTNMEPYAMTNKGLRIRMRIWPRSYPGRTRSHFAILECRDKDNWGTLIAIPTKQVPSGEFFRTVDEDVNPLDHSQVSRSDSKEIYLHRSGPVWQSEPAIFYPCWLRNYGRDFGIGLVHSLFIQDHLSTAASTQDPIEQACITWDHESKSMTWSSHWSGMRAALQFYNPVGPVAYHIVDAPTIHLTPVHYHTNDTRSTTQSLGQLLAEVIPSKEGKDLSKKRRVTFKLNKVRTTVEFKQELLHNEKILVLIFWHYCL